MNHEAATRRSSASIIPAMMIESRNAVRASSILAIDVTRSAIFPVSGTFAFTVFFRRGFGVSSRFRLSCCDERLFGLCFACGRFDESLRLASVAPSLSQKCGNLSLIVASLGFLEKTECFRR